MEYGHEEEPKKTYVAPEDFPDLLNIDQLQAILAHQQNAFQHDKFVAEPLPQPDNDSMRSTYQTLAENRELYDDEIDDAIQDDEIIRAILPQDRSKLTPEVGRAIRARSSVIAAQCILMADYVQVNELPDDLDDDDSISVVS